MKPSIYSLTRQGMQEWVLEQGEKKFRADQIWEWLYRKRVQTFEEMTNLSKDLIAKLNEQFVVNPLKQRIVQESADGTVKYLFELPEAKKEHVDFFVYADMEKRIERTMDYCKVDEEEAKKRIKKIDRERREYHKYYTGEDWMKVDNYDLMINASRIDYREMEVLMRNYLEMKGYLK